MEKSAFRTANEGEAQRALYEAFGRFVVAFERVIGELRNACRIMMERSGLRNQPLFDVIFERIGGRELAELAGAMYGEFRPNDLDGAGALEDRLLNGVRELCVKRNQIVHASWTLGVSPHPGEKDPVAHTIIFRKGRKKREKGRKHRDQCRIVLQLDYRPDELDKLTDEATKLQVYATRLCHSVSVSNLPLARELNRSL